MGGRSNEARRKLVEDRERLRGNVPDQWFEFPTSRTEAKRVNLLYYFTGEPCQKEHVALRWSSGGRCLECAGYEDIPNTIKPYTKEEDEYLINNYQTQTKPQMAEALGRSKKSVEKHLLSVLKLSINYETRDKIRKANNNSRNEKEREQHRGNVPDEWFDYPSSQEVAEKAGSEYFFTGKPCERGHIDIRGINHRQCLACNRENSIVLNQDDERKEWKRTYRKQDHVRQKSFVEN